MRLNLTTKLVAWILALSLLPVAATSYLSLQGLNEVRTDANTLHDESLLVVAQVAQAANDLASAQESFMSYVLGYGNLGATQFYTDMIDHQNSFSQFLRTYRDDLSLEVQPHMNAIVTDAGKTTLITDEQDALTSLNDQWTDYSSDAQSSITLLGQSHQLEAYSMAQNASGHLDTINGNIGSLIAINSEAAALVDQVTHDTIMRSMLYAIIAAGAVAGTVLAFSIIVGSRITRPLQAVSKAADSMAKGDFKTRVDLKAPEDEVGDLVRSMNAMLDNTSQPLIELTECAQAIAAGDLSREITVQSTGDFALLVEAFKMMRSNLAGLTKEIRAASESLTESSASLASTIGEMTQSTQQVSTSVAQTSKSAMSESEKIDEMVRMLSEQTKAIYDVVQSSQNAAGASANASEVAQNGSKSAQHALERMNFLLKNVEGTSDAMKQLAKKSKEISQIVSIITNIAQQTNLLSLNAAIEAARAGEQGRGFAVVADEVRKLAEGSRKAASQIQQLIELVEHDIEETTQKMEHTMKDATESSSTISDSLKSLEDIAATVEETAAMVEEISASTEEQKALTESLAKSLDEVALIAKENSSSSEGVSASSEALAAGMEELTASAEELAELAAKLNVTTKKVDRNPVEAAQEVMPSKPDATAPEPPTGGIDG